MMRTIKDVAARAQIALLVVGLLFALLFSLLMLATFLPH
jgi:hypothetical protein